MRTHEKRYMRSMLSAGPWYGSSIQNVTMQHVAKLPAVKNSQCSRACGRTNFG